MDRRDAYDVPGKLEDFAGEEEAVRIVGAEYGAEVELTLAVRRVNEEEVRTRPGALLQRDPGDFD